MEVCALKLELAALNIYVVTLYRAQCDNFNSFLIRLDAPHHHHHHHFIVKFRRSDQGYKVCLTHIEPVIYKCYIKNIQ
jgi:hypothetical protein